MLRFTAIILIATFGSVANAAAETGSRPQVLSTQRGIGDPQRGIGDPQRDATVLRSAPPAHADVNATQPRPPAYDQQGNGAAQYPLIIAPYIEVPGVTPPPNPPRPAPHRR